MASVYAQIVDIEAEYKSFTVSSNTAINSTKLQSFLDQADAEINSYIGMKYTLPLTGAETLNMMKQVAVWIVKDRLDPILALKGPTMDVVQNGKSPQSTRDKAISMLKDIRDGKLLLRQEVTATPADGVRSYNNDNSITPFFQRNVKQW